MQNNHLPYDHLLLKEITADRTSESDLKDAFNAAAEKLSKTINRASMLIILGIDLPVGLFLLWMLFRS